MTCPRGTAALLTRRAALHVAAGMAVAAAGCRQRSGKFVVGFSQMDSGGAWRAAETDSLRAAAAERAAWLELIVTDAQDQTAKQVGDVEDLVARRVGALFVAPREFEGLAPALDAARRAGVPVFLIDREAEGKPGVDYVTFVGSDFADQGRRAGEWLARATDGRAAVIELAGTTGSSAARDRGAGFRAGIASHPGVGPPAFAALDSHLAGDAVPPRTLVADRLFDAANAAACLADAY